VLPVVVVTLLSSTLVPEEDEEPLLLEPLLLELEPLLFVRPPLSSVVEVELPVVAPVVPVVVVVVVVTTVAGLESSDDLPVELLPLDEEEELEDVLEVDDLESSEPLPELLLPDEELDWARASEEPARSRLARARIRRLVFMRCVWFGLVQLTASSFARGMPK